MKSSIVIILHVLFPGESSWEEVRRVEVATFRDCRIVQRELRRTLTVVDGLPYITSCVDENEVSSGPVWMRTDRDDVDVTTTTTVKKGKSR